MGGRVRRGAVVLAPYGLYTISVTALWWLLLTMAAAANPVVYNFDISARDTRGALEEFALISGEQLSYDAALLAGKRSQALRGRFDAEQGLRILLSGTGLGARRLASRVFIITPLPPVKTVAAQVPLASELVPSPIETVVVRGVKASLRSAMLQKKRATYIMDALIAEDIGKLPDGNLAEAMQRLTGVQAARNRGEGSGIAIRGLSQINSLINGREIYSDSRRDFSLEYLPSEILSGVNLRRTSSANQIEGGIGGLIEFRTRRPFDFEGDTVALTLRANYYDFASKVRPQATGLISRRFHTTAGEIGLLFAAADIRTTGRSDQLGMEPFGPRYNLVDYNGNGIFDSSRRTPAQGADPGDLVIAPLGGGNTIETTERRRNAYTGVVQWRPGDGIELTLEGFSNRYRYEQSSYNNFVNWAELPAAPQAVFRFHDTGNIVQSGAYANAIFSTNSGIFDRTTYTDQIALSGKWRVHDRLRLVMDLARTHTGRDDYSGGVRIGNSADPAGALFAFDLSSDLPELELTGFPFSDAARYNLMEAGHAQEHVESTGTEFRFEGEHYIDAGAFKSFEFGVRLTDRDTRRLRRARTHLYGDLPISRLPQAAAPIPFAHFYNDPAQFQLINKGVLAAPSWLVRDEARVCAGIGDTVCNAGFNPRTAFDAAEMTRTLYTQFNYEFLLATLPVTGNAGLRYVHTDLDLNGFENLNNGTTILRRVEASYGHLLPSLNLRIEVMKEQLYLRLGLASQLSRPSFSELAPDTFYNVNNAPHALLGRAGNPYLKPLESDSADLSLEYYFARSSYAYMSLFRKSVTGFIQTTTREAAVFLPEYPDFQTALITTLKNGGDGVISGYDTGIQTFLEFLPSPFDGIGVQANYTCVDSTAPGPIEGLNVPLLGLSKNSYNLIAYYEKGPYRARVAYNYRSTYVDTVSGPGSGNLAVYARPYGLVDASIGYKVSKNVDVSLEASNLTRSEFSSYIRMENQPRFYQINDRRIGVVLRLTQ